MLLITITVTNEQQISCNITQVNFGESGNRFYTQPSNIHEREEKTRYMWHERFCETNQCENTTNVINQHIHWAQILTTESPPPPPHFWPLTPPPCMWVQHEASQLYGDT